MMIYYKITVNFEYVSESTAVPSPLTATILQSADKTRLGQRGKFLIMPMSTQFVSHTVAVKMWTLGRMLPVMIGHCVPEDDEHWIHYIKLLDIVDLIFSPTVHPNMPGCLELAIEETQNFVWRGQHHTENALFNPCTMTIGEASYTVYCKNICG